MIINLDAKLSDEQKEELNKIHKRLVELATKDAEQVRNIIKTLEEFASKFPTNQHLFLFQSFRAISKDDESALRKLIKVLQLENITGIASYVFEGLYKTKDKWYPQKRENSSQIIKSILGYVRKTIMNCYRQGGLFEQRTEKTDGKIPIVTIKGKDKLFKKTLAVLKKQYPDYDEDLLMEIFPFDDVDASIPDKSNDLDSRLLIADIERIIKQDKKCKPFRIKDYMELFITIFIQEVPGDKACEVLGWDKKKVQTIYKDMQRKGVIENLKKKLKN